MAKKTANKINDVISARRQEIESTLAEMVETIEKYFLVTPFDFIDGTEAEGTYHLFADQVQKTPFNRFPAWAGNWLCSLFPRAHETQLRLENQSDFSDETAELAYDSQSFGFVLGAMVGMKAAGMSKEELLRRAQGFVIPAIEHVRYTAESDAKKEVDRGKS